MTKWMVLLLIFSGSNAFANCASLEQQATNRIAAINARMQGQGACNSTKNLIQILDINLELLGQCPEMDPTGVTKAGVINARNQAVTNANAICN